jgi:nucleotide-binding universal stress UspA family protein
MIQRILIPIDFSETSAAAADYGCELATRLGAQVTLLNVFSSGIIATPDAVFVPTAAEQEALSHAAETHLQSIAAKLDRDGLSIECVALEGIPADVICVFAARRRADLIVMGTHGRRGLTHLLLGSVAEQVLRHGPCPVLTISRASVQASELDAHRHG